MDCDLCKAKKTLKDVRFIGKKIFVIECRTCKVLMAVATAHHPAFTDEEKQEVHFAFYKALRLQGTIDWNMRTILGHAHAHLRKK